MAFQKHEHGGEQGDLIRSALVYDIMVKVLTFGREDAFRESTLDQAKVGRGDRVLDVGCGTGTLALAARRRVGPDAQVYGLDPSAEMIARATKKAGRNRLVVTFRVGSAQKLPFPDSSFDVVLSSLMLHHLPWSAREQAVREMRRVLNAEGRLLVVELVHRPNRLSSLIPVRFRHDHSHAFVEAKDLMNNVGFSEVDSGLFKWRSAGWILGENLHHRA